MNLSFQVDTGGLEEKLYLLGKEAGAAPGVVFKEETKQIAQQIVKLTPPRNLAQGRRAVATDLSRIVWAPEPDTIKWAPLKEAFEKKDAAKAAALLAKTGKTFVTDTGPIAAQHLKMRTSRGRINRGVKPFLVAFAGTAMRYVKDVQSRVGWAKGGWARTLIAAGATVPSWIARHASQAGTVIANFGPNNPSVTAIAYDVKIPRYQQIVDTAVKTRERITQMKIDRIVSGKAVNLGFMVIEAK
jgi:hypothetical protein